MRDAELDAVLLHEFHDAVRLAQVGGHRLFAEDMAAVFGGGPDRREMIAGMTRAEHDDVGMLLVDIVSKSR